MCTKLCMLPEFVKYAILTDLIFLKRTEQKKTAVNRSGKNLI